MSIKAKLYLLATVLHIFLLIAAYLFVDKIDYSFLLVEVFLVASFVGFVILIRKVLSPFQYIDLFGDILHEQEFTSRFSHTGNKQLDNLMSLFNQMLNQLYEERLRLGDRKGMLQQLLDAIPLSILVFDYNEEINQLNQAAEKLLGVSQTSVKGFQLESINHPLVRELKSLPLGVSQLVSDKEGKRYRCQKNTFKDRGFSRCFILVQELTRELDSSEKNTYEKLIRIMSHEVNNTIAATSSILKSCLNYAQDIKPEERADYQNALRLVIDRTHSLNSFMQDYAKIVRLPPPSYESCNLFHLLLTAKRLFNEELETNAIEFQLPRVEPNSSEIYADKSQIEQVLLNVVKNAIESIMNNGLSDGEKSKEIISDISSENNHLILRITDSGPGITEQAQRSIFTPFFTTKAEGQGIGLMLIRDILKSHNFAFKLYNSPNSGACFEIMFPKEPSSAS
ncbi:MAG: ATP-binding protein [Kangiellaceae bacterium]|nr:ATP-binding protein [Kangiellaceae bacterium]